jgi:hypothetical protein
MPKASGNLLWSWKPIKLDQAGPTIYFWNCSPRPLPKGFIHPSEHGHKFGLAMCPGLGEYGVKLRFRRGQGDAMGCGESSKSVTARNAKGDSRFRCSKPKVRAQNLMSNYPLVPFSHCGTDFRP